MDKGLSRREREIVEILYANGQASAEQVRAAMSDPPSDATVRTLLRILMEKGVVKHRREGRRFIYRPRTPRSGAGKSALRRVLDVFYRGNLEDAIAAHLSDPKTKLSDDQIERLRVLINEAADRDANDPHKAKS
jgi:predicted transcriptional regulator